MQRIDDYELRTHLSHHKQYRSLDVLLQFVMYLDILTRLRKCMIRQFAGKTEATLHNLALLMELHLNTGPEEVRGSK